MIKRLCLSQENLKHTPGKPKRVVLNRNLAEFSLAPKIGGKTHREFAVFSSFKRTANLCSKVFELAADCWSRQIVEAC